VGSPPNATLIRFAEAERAERGAKRVLDIGCGAARNAVPLVDLGFEVLGIDLSMPMLVGARERAKQQATRGLGLAQSTLDSLPAKDRTFDIVIAHGIWNLAASGAEFRAGVREAARVCRAGAGLFVFTFSRNTLPSDTKPVAGETFVFTQFSGRPQCFLSREALVSELEREGFTLDERVVNLSEHNLPRPGQLQAPSGPVIFEGVFRFGALSS
jgi:ubiquinone/menaquinone biosynthesis C-methylase UbiE